MIRITVNNTDCMINFGTREKKIIRRIFSEKAKLITMRALTWTFFEWLSLYKFSPQITRAIPKIVLYILTFHSPDCPL